ncbi:hypothetical protein DKM19_31285 [Streptosporangium sp. 'caverna']|nr:hypothetical protein DKM19_31285 [Streptosporangium sp. 'caverna']
MGEVLDHPAQHHGGQPRIQGRIGQTLLLQAAQPFRASSHEDLAQLQQELAEALVVGRDLLQHADEPGIGGPGTQVEQVGGLDPGVGILGRGGPDHAGGEHLADHRPGHLAEQVLP